MRGRKTGENVVFSTPQSGYLDFTDENFVAFKGVISTPAVGNNVLFEGFKINAEAAANAEPWSAFSEQVYEQVYEQERISRWH